MHLRTPRMLQSDKLPPVSLGLAFPSMLANVAPEASAERVGPSFPCKCPRRNGQRRMTSGRARTVQAGSEPHHVTFPMHQRLDTVYALPIEKCSLTMRIQEHSVPVS